MLLFIMFLIMVLTIVTRSSGAGGFSRMQNSNGGKQHSRSNQYYEDYLLRGPSPPINQYAGEIDV